MKCRVKPFSISLSHVHSRKIASSITLLPSKVWLAKITPFRCFQMVHVSATHQHFHLIALVPTADPLTCCRKWSLGFCGNTPLVFIHCKDSHHKGRVLLQLKNRCAAVSSEVLHRGHLRSFNSTCLLLRLVPVGNQSLMSLRANTAALDGILSFQRSMKIRSSFSPIFSASSS